MRFAPACTPAQESILRLDTITRAIKNLTAHDIAVLREGVRHPDGVMNPAPKSNFDQPAKRMAKLVSLGCATPNVHGDWYITQTGRDAIAAIQG